MRRLGAIVAVALVVVGAVVVRAQDEGERKGVSVAGRYQPARVAGGVLDAFSGALYYVDPESANEVVTLDLPHARAFVRNLAKDASGWGAVDLAKMDPAVVPAMKEKGFVATQGPYEVLETRTGAVYSLEAPPKARVAEWKGVRVVRTDPVLGTRVVRELHVSKRGD